MIYIVGLGNPGEEYEITRHNIGRMAVEDLAKSFDIAPSLEDFKYDKVLDAQKAKGIIANETVTLIAPDTFMNKSGKSVAPLILGSGSSLGGAIKKVLAGKGAKSPNAAKTALEKKTAKLIVIQDDLDLPLGQIKVVFNRGSGGHKGIESIKRAIKTEAFVRIKIGVIPTTPSGKLKKPEAGEKILDFILGQFQKAEMDVVKKSLKEVRGVVEAIVEHGHVYAMNQFN